jgi:H+/Cl- antiporter ClcA
MEVSIFCSNFYSLNIHTFRTTILHIWCQYSEENLQNYSSTNVVVMPATLATCCTCSAVLSVTQGCQMVCFQTKDSNLVKFSRALDWKNGYILWPFGIFYGHLGYFVFSWYILCSFGTFFRFWYHGPIKIWQPFCHQPECT